MSAQIYLKPGRDKSVRQRHPWVFSGAIQRVDEQPRNGDVVDVVAADQTWLARGTWSERSQISVRLWTWEPEQPIDDELLADRIRAAVAWRQQRLAAYSNAYRCVFGEADGLPGLIVDRYDSYVVIQVATAAVAQRVPAIIAVLQDLFAPTAIYERTDSDAQLHEGVRRKDGLLAGAAADGAVTIQEHGYRLLVDLANGHKTGAYLDQRANRQRVAAYCAGADVLSCFAYTGGFELAMAHAAPRSITTIESSEDALALAQQNYARNALTIPVAQIAGNVFNELRRLRAEEQRYDLIILDPPKFVRSRGQLDRATRGYKDINLLAMQLLRPDGILATFSCSGLVSADLFQKIVWGAAVDSGRDVQIVERLTQPADHPVRLTFPESEYLKGLICRVA